METQKTESKTENTKDVTTSTLWVNSYMGDCSGQKEENSFYLTQEGDEKPATNWDCLYREIQGFEFEKGYICQLKVEHIMTEGKPGLKLIEVVTKERDSDYFRLYDIWAATHLNGEVLPVTATRLNMEVNLNAMKIMGEGMCNRYFGKIEAYTTSTIKFGPIAGTKMMCPDIAIENNYLKALDETVFYKTKGLTLFFFNSKNEEVLRFQKVD